MACYNRWTATAAGGAVRQLACGQCRGCRLEYSRQWAIRCMHEAQMHGENNAYITLTLNDENLNLARSLDYRDFQLFMKRLRQWWAREQRKNLLVRDEQKSKQEPTKCTPPLQWGATENRKLKFPKSEKQIRFYMSGEYGEKDQRPHYHAILFGVRFADMVYLKKSPSGENLYTSATLDKLWGKGFTSVGNVTFQSAAYVARYVMKKVNGEKAKAKYEKLNTETGEIEIRKPEFSNMSRHPGLGTSWIKRYKADVYPHGKVVVNGRETNPPKFYDRLHKKTNPLAHQQMTDKRIAEAQKRLEDNTNSRLDAKEKVLEAKLSQLKRTL